MKPNEIKLPYGLKDGTLIHIAVAENGLACGCTCPACHQPLVARKGNIKVPHFAHHSVDPCSHGLETALHLACKAILAERREIVLPQVEIKFTTYRDPFVIAPERRYTFTEVHEESRTEDIIPDLRVMIEGRPLLIEIHVTHAVDDAKLNKIKRIGIAAVEIDFSSLPRDFTHDALADLLVNHTEKKKWIFNPVQERQKHSLLMTGETKPVIQRGLALHVDYCPINAREWRGKSYANVLDDCINCKYCLGYDDNKINCGGRLKIETIAQLRAHVDSRNGHR